MQKFSDLKRYLKRADVFDIIVFGSSTKGKAKPGDVDICIIFYSKPDFSLIAELRSKGFDVTFLRLEKLDNEDPVVKKAIISEGFSLRFGKRVSEIFGFSQYAIVVYRGPRNRSFYFALSGRNGTRGILQETGGIRLGKGVIAVPVNKLWIFEKFLKFWGVEYTIISALLDSWKLNALKQVVVQHANRKEKI